MAEGVPSSPNGDSAICSTLLVVGGSHLVQSTSDTPSSRLLKTTPLPRPDQALFTKFGLSRLDQVVTAEHVAIHPAVARTQLDTAHHTGPARAPRIKVTLCRSG